MAISIQTFAYGAIFGTIIGFTTFLLGASASLALSFGLAIYLGFVMGRAVW